ncbi:MAG TPA: hypothetical protein VGA52_05290, partial [Anaerolineales bacterium]
MSTDRLTDAQVSNSFTPPYAPSWVDRLTEVVDRLPWPWWLTYMLSGLAVFAAVALLQSATVGNSPVRYLPFHIWSQGYFAYLLALLHALDRSAAVALQAFRPVLVFDKLERGEVRTFEELDYRLTTMPPRPAMLAAV